jgi:DNA-directed RNA polymerase specialized sigma24 family protein
MSLSQIASVLELKVGSVKSQLARATSKLREMRTRDGEMKMKERQCK